MPWIEKHFVPNPACDIARAFEIIKGIYVHQPPMILSQLGYDSRLPSYGFLRLAEEGESPRGCAVLDQEQSVITTLPFSPAGSAWGSAYWKVDLSGLAEGRYQLRYAWNGNDWTTERFVVEKGRFFQGAWQRFHYELSIRFIENRLPNGGFMDCGSPLRELSSHSETGQVLARCLRSPLMDDHTKFYFTRHFQEINRYVRACRVEPGVYAHEAEGGSGHLHELCRGMRTLHDTAYAGLLHLESWLLFRDEEDWRDALECWCRLVRDLPEARHHTILPSEKYEERRRFEPWLMSGVPPEEPLPGEYRTPVLLRMLHLGWKIYCENRDADVYREVEGILSEVAGLQVTGGAAGEVGGDFLAWPGMPQRLQMFEDSWVEYFKGCVHGHYLGGVTEIASVPGPLQEPAAKILNCYIDDWFLPLSQSNPFGLPPNGVFADRKPRWFSGMRHGMNGTYGLLMADLLRAGRALGRTDLRIPAAKIALWFAGVNHGMRTSESAPWHGVSCHYARGEYFANCWTRMPNAVSNGFSCGPQFHIQPVGDVSEDQPLVWHDEDWILHGAAVVDLLTELEIELS